MANNKTDFGNFCLGLRKKQNETMTDMARKLDISRSHLAAIEHGEYKPPLRWKEKIAELYSLNVEQQKELEKCFDEEYAKSFEDLTDLGVFCRKLRLSKNESAHAMARRLHITTTILYKVEQGKMRPPLRWKKEIPAEYSLTEEQQEKLKEYIDKEYTEAHLTNFGKFCRELRQYNNELLPDMARKLNTSVYHLSAIEHGKKRPPLRWRKEIASIYVLDKEQQAELNKCIRQQHMKPLVKLSNLTCFGLFCWRLRVQCMELPVEMSKRLGVSPYRLLSIARGKHRPPLEWKRKIADEYSLNKEQQEELNRCIDLARE